MTSHSWVQLAQITAAQAEHVDEDTFTVLMRTGGLATAVSLANRNDLTSSSVDTLVKFALRSEFARAVTTLARNAALNPASQVVLAGHLTSPARHRGHAAQTVSAALVKFAETVTDPTAVKMVVDTCANAALPRHAVESPYGGRPTAGSCFERALAAVAVRPELDDAATAAGLLDVLVDKVAAESRRRSMLHSRRVRSVLADALHTYGCSRHRSEYIQATVASPDPATLVLWVADVAQGRELPEQVKDAIVAVLDQTITSCADRSVVDPTSVDLLHDVWRELTGHDQARLRASLRKVGVTTDAYRGPWLLGVCDDPQPGAHRAARWAAMDPEQLADSYADLDSADQLPAEVLVALLARDDIPTEFALELASSMNLSERVDIVAVRGFDYDFLVAWYQLHPAKLERVTDTSLLLRLVPPVLADNIRNRDLMLSAGLLTRLGEHVMELPAATLAELAGSDDTLRRTVAGMVSNALADRATAPILPGLLGGAAADSVSLPDLLGSLNSAMAPGPTNQSDTR